ncbi:hypothetical protein JTE90_009306 [Oedothorax gibbosus]|uniref:Uncharacterized protein n=1 Tax=Oedothorax gibbosus TaxID=931172 RepID=A0AAV6TDC5_9ARAC|nr:hypothetical protein JTE90_009306 [Oedothorax gibbosus]
MIHCVSSNKSPQSEEKSQYPQYGGLLENVPNTQTSTKVLYRRFGTAHRHPEGELSCSPGGPAADNGYGTGTENYTILPRIFKGQQRRTGHRTETRCLLRDSAFLSPDEPDSRDTKPYKQR